MRVSVLSIKKKSERLNLYNDPKVQALLTKAMEEEKEFIPTFDKERMPRFILVEKIMGKNPKEAIEFLDELTFFGILKKEIYERLVCCPKCKLPSSIFPRYKCPKCSSLKIEVKRIIEHFICGAMKEEKKFRKNDKLICPVCKNEIKGIGIDCRLIGITCICNSCNSSFDEPIHTLLCRNCNYEFSFSNAYFMDIYKYSLNEDVLDEIKHIVALPILKAVVEKAGFKIQIPSSIQGFSGIAHKFTIVCKKDSIIVAIDLFQSREEVSLQEILASFAKFADTKPKLPIIAATPKLSKEAAIFIDSNNIIRIEGETIKEVAEKLEKFLSSKVE